MSVLLPYVPHLFWNIIYQLCLTKRWLSTYFEMVIYLFIKHMFDKHSYLTFEMVIYLFIINMFTIWLTKWLSTYFEMVIYIFIKHMFTIR